MNKKEFEKLKAIVAENVDRVSELEEKCVTKWIVPYGSLNEDTRHRNENCCEGVFISGIFNTILLLINIALFILLIIKIGG